MKPPLQVPALVPSSARFDGAASKLSLAPTTDGNLTKWTFSCWCKNFDPDTLAVLFVSYVGALDYDAILFNNNQLIYLLTKSTTQIEFETTRLFRDPASHYHIVVSRNGLTVSMEVNGVAISNFDVSTQSAVDGYINDDAATHYLGALSASSFFKGLMSEIYFLDGTIKTAADFGEYNAAGVWVPKLALNDLKIASVFGTNGFYLKDNGTDLSGNGNDYTETSMATDVDTPTNNLPRLNPLINGAVIGAKNLTSAIAAQGTFGISEGAIYWEVDIATGTPTPIGVIAEDGTINSVSLTNITYGLRLDMDAGTLDYWSGGGWTSIATGLSGMQFPYASTATFIMNFGGSAYTYTPPDGYVDLSAKNIGAYSIDRSAQAFKVLTYVGNGLTGRKVTSLEFQPDLVWIKDMDNAEEWVVSDSVRGENKQQMLAEIGFETAHLNMLTQFDSNGFTLGKHDLVNKAAANYIAFCFKKDSKYGIDIVEYTGDGIAGNDIPHNLGVVPKFIHILSRDGNGSSHVYHAELGATKVLYTYIDSDPFTDTNIWNDTEPTASVFTVGSGSPNNDGKNYIAYLFAEIPGFSRVFSYDGNNNTDGPFVFCGFKPVFLLIKRTDTTGSWHIFNSVSSPENPADDFLLTDTTDAEVTGSATYIVDLLSNGFKVRNTGVDINAAAGVYVGIAFAEMPLEHAHAV